jgi:hypothetical protein
MPTRTLPTILVAIMMAACPAFAQQDQNPSSKRILGVLPNYRTAEMPTEYHPLTARQKLKIATKDTFDWPLLFIGAGYAGLYQMENQNPSFGQGVEGYARRYATSYADQAMGNMMTEGIMPALLREDPRYFRKAHGSTRSRLAYSITRIFVTRTDAGGERFNFSEVVGNSIAVAVSNTYYPESRTAAENADKLTMQLGTDMMSNILKEFWPDIRKRMRRHRPQDVSADLFQ